MKTYLAFTVVLVLILSLRPLTIHAQGTLTPPGAPAATMLTLLQVQPRLPVDSVHTPGNSGAVFAITLPGAYYLTTNIMGVSSKHGIEIAANNVTLDLDGFSVIGPSGSEDGILTVSGVTNAVIRNGIISGWTAGIDCLGNYDMLENLTVYDASSSGIVFFGNGGVVKNCVVSGNAQYGVLFNGPDALIASSTLSGNNTINVANGAAIFINSTNNCIEDNHITGSGPAGGGIYMSGTNNVVIRNEVIGNGANDYIYTSPQFIGPLINNTLSGMITNSNPWANFAF